MSSRRRNAIKTVNPQTPRRQSIIAGVRNGESINAIAQRLGLSFETVREHLKILRKAGIIATVGDRRVVTKLARRKSVAT